MKLLDRLSERIFEKLLMRKGRKPDQSLVKELCFLHPGEDVSKLYRDFCIKRIRLTCLTLLAGIILTGLMKLSFLTDLAVPKEGFEREEWNGKNQKIELTAYAGDYPVDVDVKLGVRELTEEEIKEYAGRFEKELPDMILGDNPDLMNVSSGLELKEKYEGYPFECIWSSSEPELIRAYNGEVFSDEEGNVTLKVRYSFGELEGSREIKVHVCRPYRTEEEILSEEIKKVVLESEAEGRNEKEWTLPDSADGKLLRWEYRREDNSMLLGGLFAAVAAMLYIAAEKDLGKTVEKRKQNMRSSYPKVLREMALYVGAGMTVKTAFKRIASDADDSNEKEYIFDEMKRSCREMEQGIGEGECYERFGNRTGLGEYIKFSALLSQNLKRGNPNFRERLQEEANIAMREKALKAKKSGEEAQTKMLAPMMMMLAVVMVMIMIPAMTGMDI